MGGEEPQRPPPRPRRARPTRCSARIGVASCLVLWSGTFAVSSLGSSPSCFLSSSSLSSLSLSSSSSLAFAPQGLALPASFGKGLTRGQVAVQMKQQQQRDDYGNEEEDAEEKDELFDYFDPRLSPHEYPHGIDAAAGATDSTGSEPPQEASKEEDWIPFGLSKGSSFQSMQEAGTEEPAPPPPTVFDPRLSPHLYSNGVPRVVGNANAQQFADSGRKRTPRRPPVGILLIDHGSRRESSNEQLEQIASLYQSRCPPHYQVRAAHMEIASPTILEGMQQLMDLGVEQIVCHPYFLSPGRHVTEDIPQLVQDAVAALNRPNVSVVTSLPVGANLDAMISVIAQSVEATLEGAQQEATVKNFGFQFD